MTGGAICYSPQKSIYANGYRAGADLTTSVYKGVAFGTDGRLVVANATSGNKFVGFLQDAAREDQAPDVIAFGGCFAMAGAAIALGDYLKLDSSGRVIPVTNIGDTIVGWASFGTAAAGDVFGILAMKGQYGGDGSGNGSIGTAAGTGVTAGARSSGVQQIPLTFVNTPVVMADNAGVVAYGSLKIFDFAPGRIQILGSSGNLALTKSSAGIFDTWDGDWGVGTTAADNSATLATTEQNIIPTTATPQAVAGATTATGGSTAVSAIFDGTTTPVDAYLNFLVDDADHDVTTTPANIIVNGTILLTVVNYGDY